MALKTWEGSPVQFEGAVLATRERNYYDDSDFYALVWDGQEVKSVEYSTTRYAATGWAREDATPETLAAAGAWAYEQAWRTILQASIDAAARPEIGKRVRVKRGKRAGAEGEVFWQGANQFRRYYRNGYNRPDQDHNQRLGVRCDDGTTLFTEFQNAEVVSPEDYCISEAEARERAEPARGNPVGTWLRLYSSLPFLL